MDPGTALATVGLASQVLSILSKYYAEVKSAKVNVDRLSKEIHLYRELMRDVTGLIERAGPNVLPATSVLAITDSFDDIRWLEEKLNPGKTNKTMRRLGVRALKWPLSKAETDERITRLERHKMTLNIALNSDQISMALGSNEHQQLLKLPYVRGAAFDSYDRQHESRCTPDTRIDILQRLQEWNKLTRRCIFWLNGMAGTGKSTIAHTIAAILDKNNDLGGSFFFTRGRGDLSQAACFVTTLAHQLSNRIAKLKPCICEAIAQNPGIIHQDLRKQWKELILEPLKLLGSQCPPFAFVIDALDECESEGDVKLILQLLVEANEAGATKLCAIVTSRPETSIRLGFRSMPEIVHEDLALHNVDREVVEHDILVFLHHEFAQIGEEHGIKDWPNQRQVELIVKASESLFIYAATVCRFVKQPSWLPPDERLELIIHSGDAGYHSTGKLDEMYTQILRCSTHGAEITSESKRFRYVVGSIVVLFDILSATDLSSLLGLSKRQVEVVLSPLHSLLNVPNNSQSPIRLLHPSFRDFLLDKSRCKDSRFQVNRGTVSKDLSHACLQLLNKSLKKNLCALEIPKSADERPSQDTIDNCLPTAVQYACQYWVEHLEQSSPEQRVEAGLCDRGQVDYFFHVHLLHWFEALSLMRKISEGIQMMIKLELMLKGRDCDGLLATVYDAKRFLLGNRAVLEEAPLQLYSSALLFAPSNSLTRARYFNEAFSWINLYPPPEIEWGRYIQTLEGYGCFVRAVAFSPDGRLVSGSDDHAIRYWDPTTGALLLTLEGHCGAVNAIAFSRNGQLASGSDDGTARVWDLMTGALLRTFTFHEEFTAPKLHGVTAIAFSPDGQLLSASDGRGIRLWNPTTAALLGVLEGQVQSILFLQDGQLASASDNVIRLWDPHSRVELHKLAGHIGSITSMVSLPDGNLVSSSTREICFWNPASQALLGKLNLPYIESLACSSKGAVAWISGGQAQVWNPEEGVCSALRKCINAKQSKRVKPPGDCDTCGVEDLDQRQLIFKNEIFDFYADSVAFSLDDQQLVLSSDFGVMSIWDLNKRVDCSAHASADIDKIILGRYAAISSDGLQLASISRTGTMDIWDTVRGQKSRTFKLSYLDGHSIMYSPNNKQLAVGFEDSVHLYDPATGRLQARLDSLPRLIDDIVYSPDSMQLAMVSIEERKSIVADLQVWDTATGRLQFVLKCSLDLHGKLAFSPEGKRLARASCGLELWDPKSGGQLAILKLPDDIFRVDRDVDGMFATYAIVYSPDGKLIATSCDECIVLWDPIQKQLLHVFDIPGVQHLNFSDDASRIFTEHGVIQLAPSAISDSSHPPDSSIWSFSLSGWLCRDGKRMLWIPPHLRPPLSNEPKYCRDLIAVINNSGNVSFYRHQLNLSPAENEKWIQRRTIISVENGCIMDRRSSVQKAIS